MFLSWSNVCATERYAVWISLFRSRGLIVVSWEKGPLACCDCGYRKESSFEKRRTKQTGWSRKGAEGAAGLK